MKSIRASFKYKRFIIIQLLLMGAFIMTASNLNAKIITENIEYKQGNTVLEGYIAYDDELKGKRPGVLIVHQWMGLKDYEKMRAEQIARHLRKRDSSGQQRRSGKTGEDLPFGPQAYERTGKGRF